MNKKELFNELKNKVDSITDYDDKIDYLLDEMVNNQKNDEMVEAIKEVYNSISLELEDNIDPKLQEFYEILESTNELIMNEKYEDVINLLKPYESLVNELMNIESIDQDKLEIGCFFNEVEKQLFYYLISDPNKDIHLLDSSISEYYSRLGLVYHNTLNYKNAFECYKNILSFNPCSNQTLLGMAYLSYYQENYLTALEYLKEFAKYAFFNDMIFEAYNLLVNIYIKYEKYDYVALFAYFASSFAPTEELKDKMDEVYETYKRDINFDLDDDQEIDKFLSLEEFKYFPNDDVMDVLYTLLIECKEHENLKEQYIELAQLILSLVDDEELETELEKTLKEYN